MDCWGCLMIGLIALGVALVITGAVTYIIMIVMVAAINAIDRRIEALLIPTH